MKTTYLRSPGLFAVCGLLATALLAGCTPKAEEATPSPAATPAAGAAAGTTAAPTTQDAVQAPTVEKSE